MSASRVLFLPLSRRGAGSGHLRRCFETAVRMNKPASIVLEDNSPDVLPASYWTKVIPGFPGDIPVLLTPAALSSSSSPSNGISGTLAVFDRRSSRREEILPWSKTTTPVLLDDDGPARDSAPFVIDTIPGKRQSGANESSLSLLNLPPRRQTPNPGGDILVSFGGEDPSSLTLPVTRILLNLGIKPSRIHLTLPPAAIGNAEQLPRGVRVLDAPGNLKEKLGDFGLVICSYGLTAWEALSSGCALISVDPSAYHAGLSLSSGFPGVGVVNGVSKRSVKKAERKLRSLMANPGYLIEAANKIATTRELHSRRSLSKLLEELETPTPRCTACGSALPPIIGRFPRQSYYRCADCGIIGLYRFETPPEDEYGSSYFESEYRQQYGKTYLEDFESIRAVGEGRLKLILHKAERGGCLLDIGCAYGPFLSAAAEAGFRPHGMDISDEAVSYVKNTLGFPALSGAFPAANPAGFFDSVGFDVITLWYVIEHFPDLQSVLKSLNGLLKRGGVLAMSTPNAAGISARRSLQGFLEKSPADHYTLWTPSSARRILSRYGFKVYKIRITGHHPERFGFSFPGRFLMRLLDFFSRLAGLGDTFEIYAVKEHSIV